MPEKFNKPVVSIHGAPRSGTTWLGEIFNSHPDVAYRYQPLFAYRFRGRLGPDPSTQELDSFLDELYRLDDDEFILQTRQRRVGVQADFRKNAAPGFLVIKMIRFHYLIENLLRYDGALKVVGLVRNPCGAINSWLKTPREFEPEWDPLREWRRGQSKNQGRPEEYFGFEKWKEVAGLFLDLESRYPDQFFLLRYEDLVDSTVEVIRAAFGFAGLDFHPQVEDFIGRSHAREVEHPDTVFRTRDVKDRWKRELPSAIRQDIERDLEGTALARFLEP